MNRNISQRPFSDVGNGERTVIIRLSAENFGMMYDTDDGTVEILHGFSAQQILGLFQFAELGALLKLKENPTLPLEFDSVRVFSFADGPNAAFNNRMNGEQVTA